MGSAIYAPLIWTVLARGLIIMAAQAGGTMGPGDLGVLAAVAPCVTANWCGRAACVVRGGVCGGRGSGLTGQRGGRSTTPLRRIKQP